MYEIHTALQPPQKYTSETLKVMNTERIRLEIHQLLPSDGEMGSVQVAGDAAPDYSKRFPSVTTFIITKGNFL